MLCVRVESLKLYGVCLGNEFLLGRPISWLYEAILREHRGEKAEDDRILIVLFLSCQSYFFDYNLTKLCEYILLQ